jgi:recombinational DNA repair ATPase RecF
MKSRNEAIQKLQCYTKEMRNYSSLGQHRTTIAALKCAEARLVSDKRGGTPSSLFDDIFTELDEIRTEKTVECFDVMGQIFFTVCRTEQMPRMTKKHKAFQCKNREVSCVTETSVHA